MNDATLSQAIEAAARLAALLPVLHEQAANPWQREAAGDAIHLLRQVKRCLTDYADPDVGG